MNKSVLIIKGFSKTEEELFTDRKIIQLYIDFFTSNAGGCFDLDTEFFIYEDPELEILQKLEFLNKNDYLIVILVGHGATKDGVQIFQLNEETIIHPGQLQFDCKRQLHIIESCRNIFSSTIEIDRLNHFIPKYKYGGIIKEKTLTREESLQIFNDALRDSSEGVIYLFACSVDEKAIDYFFLRELITRSVHIHEYFSGGAYGISNIFEHTKEKVMELSKKRQNPVKVGFGNFPFVITIT